MKARLFVILAVLLASAAWFFASPLLGLSHLARAVGSKNVAQLDERIDFTRLGRSLAPQIVWAYLNKTGRANLIGRTAASMIAGSSASLADPILGDMLNPEAVLKLLDTGQPGGKLQLNGSMAALPNGSFGKLLFQRAAFCGGSRSIPPSHASAAVELEVSRTRFTGEGQRSTRG
jgi:hypothetical protein